MCCPDRFNGPMSPSCTIHTIMLRKLNQTSLKGRIKTFYKLNDIEDSILQVFCAFSLISIIVWIVLFGPLLCVPVSSRFFP